MIYATYNSSDRSLLFEVQVFEIDYGQLRLHGVPVTVDSSTVFLFRSQRVDRKESSPVHLASIYLVLVKAEECRKHVTVAVQPHARLLVMVYWIILCSQLYVMLWCLDPRTKL